MFIVIKFLLIIFDEKHMMSIFSVLYYLKLRHSFCRYRHGFMHKVNRIFSYIRFYFTKADENLWREGQGSERTD